MHAYGFSEISLKYILSYLTNRFQRTNVNNIFSSWLHIFVGVPQGSILGPLLFNIFINDIFFFVKIGSLCNYADDNTLYAIHTDIEMVKRYLYTDFSALSTWFYENYMILNPEKCHFLCLGSKDKSNQTFTFNQTVLKHSDVEILLGIYIDSNLNFHNHMRYLSKSAGNKLNALARISSILNTNQKTLLFNSFIIGQFNYCPLVCMFCSRNRNTSINKIHERSLRLIHDDNDTSFQDLLALSLQSNIHVRNLQLLMTEVYKYLNGYSPPIMGNIFKVRSSNYNLRNSRELYSSKRATVIYGTNTVSYKAPPVMAITPGRFKKM